MEPHDINCAFCDVAVEAPAEPSDDDLPVDELRGIFRKYFCLSDQSCFDLVFCTKCKDSVTNLYKVNEQIELFQQKALNIITNLTSTLLTSCSSKVQSDDGKSTTTTSTSKSGEKQAKKRKTDDSSSIISWRRNICRQFRPKVTLQDCKSIGKASNKSVTEVPSVVSTAESIQTVQDLASPPLATTTITTTTSDDQKNQEQVETSVFSDIVETLDSDSDSEFEGSEDEHPQKSILQNKKRKTPKKDNVQQQNVISVNQNPVLPVNQNFVPLNQNFILLNQNFVPGSKNASNNYVFCPPLLTRPAPAPVSTPAVTPVINPKPQIPPKASSRPMEFTAEIFPDFDLVVEADRIHYKEKGFKEIGQQVCKKNNQAASTPSEKKKQTLAAAAITAKLNKLNKTLPLPQKKPQQQKIPAVTVTTKKLNELNQTVTLSQKVLQPPQTPTMKRIFFINKQASTTANPAAAPTATQATTTAAGRPTKTIFIIKRNTSAAATTTLGTTKLNQPNKTLTLLQQRPPQQQHGEGKQKIYHQKNILHRSTTAAVKSNNEIDNTNDVVETEDAEMIDLTDTEQENIHHFNSLRDHDYNNSSSNNNNNTSQIKVLDKNSQKIQIKFRTQSANILVPQSSSATVSKIYDEKGKKSSNNKNTSTVVSTSTTLKGKNVQSQLALKKQQQQSQGKRKQVLDVRSGVSKKFLNRVPEVKAAKCDLVLQEVIHEVPTEEGSEEESEEDEEQEEEDENEAEEESEEEDVPKVNRKVLKEGPEGVFTYKDKWTCTPIPGTKEFKCGHCKKTKPDRYKIVRHLSGHNRTFEKRQTQPPKNGGLPRFVVSCGDNKYMYCRKWAFEKLDNGFFKCSHSHDRPYKKEFKTMKDMCRHLQYHGVLVKRKERMKDEPLRLPESDPKVRRLSDQEGGDGGQSVETEGTDAGTVKYMYDDKWPFEQGPDGWRCGTCKWLKLTWQQTVVHINTFHVDDAWEKRRLAGKRPPRVHLGGGKYLYDFTWPYEEFEVDGVQKLKCGTCGLVEPYVRYMSDHILVAHAEPDRFACKVCGKRFIKREAYIGHRSAHGDAQFLCPQCGKQFRALPSLLIHQRRHASDWCPKPRNSSGPRPRRNPGQPRRPREPRPRQPRPQLYDPNVPRNRKESLAAAYLNNAPFKCDVCQRGYYHLESLRRHRREHKTGEDPKCPYCGLTFISYTQLREHLNRVHPLPPRPAKKKVVVNKNKKNFNKPKSSWTKVMKTISRKQAMMAAYVPNVPHKCPICERSYYHIDSMLCHKSRHKEDRDLPCEHCSLRFLNYYQFVDHMKHVHPEKEQPARPVRAMVDLVARDLEIRRLCQEREPSSDTPSVVSVSDDSDESMESEGSEEVEKFPDDIAAFEDI